VQQWKRTAPHQSNEHEHYHYITLCAAQWGADQELEATLAEVSFLNSRALADRVRTARRPPPQAAELEAQ
jgi:hypothetical protein